MAQVQGEAASSAPPERVWELLTDVAGWPRWSTFDDATVESGSGVGMVYTLRAGKVASTERITDLAPPAGAAPGRMSYELVRGLPLKRYRAEVTVTPTATGTGIRWQSRFDPPVPGVGWLAERRLAPIIQALTTALAREAERPGGAGR